ncbi:PucR family transcriptional regulator [Actinomadura sp. RB99]|uniref:PucR family transcriptional regulator n=1 Tax=Actinomadura sp. RB99 TaxID=2691577 RepID=UPI001684128D|nr:PucR family transcriptional regulator [Actinomadura sp. RB99]
MAQPSVSATTPAPAPAGPEPAGAAPAAPAPTGPAPAAAADQVPVRTLLAEPLLRGTLVAGASGLDRGVGWCLPLSETRTDPGAGPGPDLAGVAVHLPVAALAPPDEAAAVVAGLVRREAAALLAWRPRGDDADLSAASRAADAAGVPLLVLPAEADYRAVSRLVGQKALAQAAHILEYGTRVHRTLAEVLAHGPGIPAMAHAIVGLSRCSVLICDAEGERLAWAETPDGPAPDPDAVQAALPAPPPRGPDAVLDGHAHAAEAELAVAPGVTLNALITPVVVGGEPFGRLVMVERTCPPDPHDLAQHRVVAEHGATLIGSEMLRQRSVRAAEERARGDFVEALVHGRFADPHELGARARHHDFDVDGHYAVHVVSAAALLPVGRDYLRRTVTATRTAQTLEPAGCTLTAAIGSTIVVIRQVTAGPDPLKQRAEAARFAERLHRALRAQLGEDLRVTHGRPGAGAAGVAAGYHEARLAMGLAWHTSAAPVCGYDDLRVFAALKDVAGSAEAKSFAQETLAPLRRANGGDLEQIVLAYIRTSGNLNAAARELGMHRNTMLYKLDRASRALRMDIRSADAQFMFWLALHIDTLTTVTGSLADEMAPPAAAPR